MEYNTVTTLDSERQGERHEEEDHGKIAAMEKPADGSDADAALWGKAGWEDICHAGAGCGWISECGLCEL